MYLCDLEVITDKNTYISRTHPECVTGDKEYPMSIDIADLVDEACRRADVSLAMLTDDKIDSLVVIAQPYDPSVVVSEDSLRSLVTGIALLLDQGRDNRHAVQFEDDLIEDCRDYWPFASFMRAIIAILTENPDRVPGAKLNPFVLRQVQEVVGE